MYFADSAFPPQPLLPLLFTTTPNKNNRKKFSKSVFGYMGLMCVHNTLDIRCMEGAFPLCLIPFGLV